MIPQTGPYPSFFHGSKYNDTKTFDDGVLLGLSLSLTHKVKEINIFHDNKFCYGLEVIYMDPATGKSTITSGKHKGNDAGWTTSTSNFKLDNDEYLTEVGGGSGAWMDRIYFCTSKNKKQSFGGPGGTPFSYIAPIGHHFGTFSVGIGGHLHNFELRAIPLPNAVLNLGALPPPQGQTNPGLNLGALPPPAQPNPGLNLGALPPPGQPNPGLNLGALPPPQPQPGPGLNLGGLPPPPGPAPIPPQGGAFDININFGNVGLNLNPLGGFNSNPVAPPPGGFISLPGPGAGAGNPFANRNPKKRATKSQAVGNGGGIYFDDLLEHLDGNFFDAALDQVTLYYDMRSAQGLETTYKDLKGTYGPFRRIHASASGYQMATIKLEFGEHISEISGRASDKVDYLKIKTSRGKIIEGGAQLGGVPFTLFAATLGKDILGFGGSIGSCLHSLYVYHK